MRWSLWLVLIGLLLASLTRTPPVATALATGLVTAGFGAQRRFRDRLPHHRCGVAGSGRAALLLAPVVLSPRERELFRAIEGRLETEDPDFARRLRSLTRPRTAPGPGEPLPPDADGPNRRDA
ncbi:DUF3040 domain-containing protein [Saccharothrix sp. BKS2]|uniref:DUF3040 domain-containing protein n=1 Tax=Saccharothrix sp. BKS2 TaxID=3064400 RepID=UPI0039E78D6A